MDTFSKSHRGRMAIRAFKTLADAMALQGFYKPASQSGRTLEKALRIISPEIYGTMNDPRSIELKGLEYVIDRLPVGIESCTRIVLTAQEELEHTAFERRIPLKRRRLSYCVSAREICFVITRGLSEIYDVLTHLTFLNIEAHKIYQQMRDDDAGLTPEWRMLEATLQRQAELTGRDLDQALWNLSLLLGRTYQETKSSYEYLERVKQNHGTNSGLFHIIYGLGQRVDVEAQSRDNELQIYFTPALQDIIGFQKYGQLWAQKIKRRLKELDLQKRPLHVISANLHSVVNLLYGWAATQSDPPAPLPQASDDLYTFCVRLKQQEQTIKDFARAHGLTELPDHSGAHINAQIIDSALLEGIAMHPVLRFDPAFVRRQQPILLVIDYAFGAQAFEIMDELLSPLAGQEGLLQLNFSSISVMGKAGILPGKMGDIMLATAHVLEGTPHNYVVQNDLAPQDFDQDVAVFVGPMVTVLGTSLQNRDVLKKFQESSWRAVGLEMEGGHFQRAISAAIIRGHIPADIKVRYAYYASDNPLISGQTLASGSMGAEGIRPTYMVTKLILEKILAPSAAQNQAL